MRSVVAIVETRPATVAEDYRRVLELAALSGFAPKPPRLLLDMDGGTFRPGYGATPWQLSGTLSWLAESARGSRVLAVTPQGVRPVPESAIWQDILTGHGAVAATAVRMHRHVSGLVHPSLDEVLPNGVELPVDLTKDACLVLTVPTLRPAWVLAGAVACLQSIVTRGRSIPRRVPHAEVAAEALAEVNDLVPRLAVVLDGTFWGVAGGWGGSRRVARNVLLAGNDPLAVDAVALRLAGVDPMRVPWARLCADRGCGQASRDDVRIVGRRDLLDLDFDLPGDTFTAESARHRSVFGSVISRLWRRRNAGLDGTDWSGINV